MYYFFHWVPALRSCDLIATYNWDFLIGYSKSIYGAICGLHYDEPNIIYSQWPMAACPRGWRRGMCRQVDIVLVYMQLNFEGMVQQQTVVQGHHGVVFSVSLLVGQNGKMRGQAHQAVDTLNEDVMSFVTLRLVSNSVHFSRTRLFCQDLMAKWRVEQTRL